MNKRGLSYVDWVISLGTFLIAVFFVFIVVRPYLYVQEKNTALMDIAEQGFFGISEWSVKEVSLFIVRLQDRYTQNGQEHTARVRVFHSPAFGHDLTSPPSSQVTVSEGNPLFFQCVSGVCTTEKVTLVFSPLNGGKELPDLGMECEPDDASVCDATLGATSTVKGLRAEKVAALSRMSYNTLKQQWGYPAFHDFSIFVDGQVVVQGPEVPQQGAVYVKERKYWMVDEKNVRTPVTLRFQVW